MVAINYIGQIFTRNGWTYKIDTDGNLLTNIDGVIILIRPSEYNSVNVVSWVCAAENPHAAGSRAADVQTFVNELNQLFKIGNFLFNRDRAVVLLAVGAEVTGTSQDDGVVATALLLAVDAAQAFGSLVASLIDGQLSLSQVRQMLYKALHDFEENSRKRSA